MTSTFQGSTPIEQGQASHGGDVFEEVTLEAICFCHGVNIPYIYVYANCLGNVPVPDY